MDVFFLTGAGTEPAQSIARRLVSAGSRVYGFDARFPEQGFQNADFIPVPLDMTDIAAVRTAASKILATETILSGVIFAAGQTVEDPFESTHPDDISLALVSGLVAPLLLARMALPSLVRCRGHIIAITNDTPGQDGTVLNATVAGALREFTRTLFEELRDTGTKTAHLRIGHNTGRTDPAARTTQTPQSEVQPDIVADTVLTLLRLRENNALTELVLRPQATRETPRLPVTADPRLRAIQVVQLPLPQHFPPPDEAIYTPPR
ncbi:MAG: SDR family NAD(P)-dependent oxidoreductase, partial [Puniceicoccales bacterium]|nr:SDR family NAD(P)-dependent oxidoreductase [Puniceicoccales bacterium]